MTTNVIKTLQIQWRIFRNMARASGYGSELYLDPANGTAFTLIGTIVDGFESTAEFEEADLQILGDFWKTSEPVSGDPGTLKFKVILDNNDTTYQSLVNLAAAANTNSDPSKSIGAWKIVYRNANGVNGVTLTPDIFSGWIKSISRTVQRKDLMVADIEVRITGVPGLINGTSGI